MPTAKAKPPATEPKMIRVTIVAECEPKDFADFTSDLSKACDELRSAGEIISVKALMPAAEVDLGQP